jgi:hypothetical protein
MCSAPAWPSSRAAAARTSNRAAAGGRARHSRARWRWHGMGGYADALEAKRRGCRRTCDTDRRDVYGRAGRCPRAPRAPLRSSLLPSTDRSGRCVRRSRRGMRCGDRRRWASAIVEQPGGATASGSRRCPQTAVARSATS